MLLPTSHDQAVLAPIDAVAQKSRSLWMEKLVGIAYATTVAVAMMGWLYVLGLAVCGVFIWIWS
jgi:hypothetical protein